MPSLPAFPHIAPIAPANQLLGCSCQRKKGWRRILEEALDERLADDRVSLSALLKTKKLRDFGFGTIGQIRAIALVETRISIRIPLAKIRNASSLPGPGEDHPLSNWVVDHSNTQAFLRR
jgi:hypothetical protein